MSHVPPLPQDAKGNSRKLEGNYFPSEIDCIEIRTIQAPNPDRAFVAFEVRYLQDGCEIEVSDELCEAVRASWSEHIFPLMSSWFDTYGAIYNFSVSIDPYGTFQVKQRGFSIIVHEQLWHSFHSHVTASSREIVREFRDIADHATLSVLEDDVFELITASRCYRQYHEVVSLVPDFLCGIRDSCRGKAVH